MVAVEADTASDVRRVRRTTTSEVLALGRAGGLDAVGVARARPLVRARQALEERKAAGLHGGMQFTYKNPARSTDPARSVAGATSIVVGARSYFLPTPARPEGPAGRVARYAWTDHYAPLRAALRDIALHLRSQGWKAVVFADDNSIVDREVAYEAGIGWFGKNANVLLPGHGSWYVLGCVVTDAPLDPTARAPVADGCSTCRRCLDGCPTQAIVAPGVIDARRCLAWLVQQPGTFPVEFRDALGDRLYGCDDCQDVCPINRRAEPTQSAGDLVAWVPIVELLRAADEELLARHGRWYLHDRQPRWLRRNALIVLGNTGDAAAPDVVSVLADYLAGDDEMLREHATWAAQRLGLHHLVHDPAGAT